MRASEGVTSGRSEISRSGLVLEAEELAGDLVAAFLAVKIRALDDGRLILHEAVAPGDGAPGVADVVAQRAFLGEEIAKAFDGAESWFVVDDMSAHFSCYGETLIQTPAVDRLAAEGTRFTRAYVTAPVCSACRSALITGMYQTTIGAHHHRSGRGELKIHLPEACGRCRRCFIRPAISPASAAACPGLPRPTFRRAAKAARKKPRPAAMKGRLGKTDYNFEWDPRCTTATTGPGAVKKPFFMQVQLHGGKLRAESSKQMRALAKRAHEELGSGHRSARKSPCRPITRAIPCCWRTGPPTSTACA
jgi:hypothetical protein